MWGDDRGLVFIVGADALHKAALAIHGCCRRMGSFIIFALSTNMLLGQSGMACRFGHAVYFRALRRRHRRAPRSILIGKGAIVFQLPLAAADSAAVAGEFFGILFGLRHPRAVRERDVRHHTRSAWAMRAVRLVLHFPGGFFRRRGAGRLRPKGWSGRAQFFGVTDGPGLLQVYYLVAGVDASSRWRPCTRDPDALAAWRNRGARTTGKVAPGVRRQNTQKWCASCSSCSPRSSPG